MKTTKKAKTSEQLQRDITNILNRVHPENARAIEKALRRFNRYFQQQKKAA